MAGQHPLQFRGIDHVVLKVTDIERTLHFYTEILGLALERVIEDLQIYQLRCGRNLIDLQVAPAGTLLAPRESRGIEHLCLMVQGDFAAVREALEKALGAAESSKLTWKAQTPVMPADFDSVQKLTNLLDALDDHDDVQDVVTNVEDESAWPADWVEKLSA